MGDRYRKYVDKRAIKMPTKIGSKVSDSVSDGRTRKIITKTEHLDLPLALSLTSYSKQKNDDCFSN